MGAIYRKDETETVSHSLITKFETKKKKITNLRQWPRPLLQNFKTKKIVVKNDVSSGGVGRQSRGGMMNHHETQSVSHEPVMRHSRGLMTGYETQSGVS